MPATASFFDSSLTRCSQLCRRTRAQVLRSLQENCPDTHSRIRYALAKELGRYLGESYCQVLAVYVFGSTMNDTAGKMSDLDLLVLVKDKTACLDNSVHLLNDGLLSSYRIALNDNALPLHTLLDVHIVDAAEMFARRGYGALITSTFEPPIKIWSRDQEPERNAS